MIGSRVHTSSASMLSEPVSTALDKRSGIITVETPTPADASSLTHRTAAVGPTCSLLLSCSAVFLASRVILLFPQKSESSEVLRESREESRERGLRGGSMTPPLTLSPCAPVCREPLSSLVCLCQRVLSRRIWCAAW